MLLRLRRFFTSFRRSFRPDFRPFRPNLRKNLFLPSWKEGIFERLSLTGNSHPTVTRGSRAPSHHILPGSLTAFLNSQAPDVPELAHQGIFQLSRLSINCYVKTTKKCSLYLSRTDFLKILSVPQDHCGSHNNLMKFFSKNYTLYGVYIFSNFGFRLNRLAFNDTKIHFYISEVVQR